MLSVLSQEFFITSSFQHCKENTVICFDDNSSHCESLKAIYLQKIDDLVCKKYLSVIIWHLCIFLNALYLSNTFSIEANNEYLLKIVSSLVFLI